MATTDSNTPARASNVYLFKNGYGMIVKTFEFPSSNENQTIELMDPPSNPVHGTFWIQPTSNKTSISSIRTKKTKKFVDKQCSTTEDLLQANVGQDVQILVVDDITRTKEWISGKIKSIKRRHQLSDDEDTAPDVAPVSAHQHLDRSLGVSGFPDISYSGVNPSSRTSLGDLILLETTDNGLLGLSLSSVRSIRGATLKTTYQDKVFKNCLSIDYKNESGSNEKGLMKYLTFGITWVPSYNLILSSSKDPSVKKLRLLSKAVILNDIENMNVDNLYCIVGFPNLSKFASVVDPMINGDNVQAFLDRLTQCESGRGLHQYNVNMMSNSIMTQQAVMPPMTSSINSGLNDTQQDTNTDDLYLYEFKNVLLQKKERLMLPIFDIEIPYKDVYHCKIDSLHSGSYQSGKDFEEVWHSVEFENTSDFVWTTAPVLITKGQEEQQFIGQDKLGYTTKGTTAFVNLTKALDIRVQLEEKGTNANPTRFSLSRVNYQSDNIEGKLVIMNHKSEEVIVVINIILMGKMSNYSIAPKKDIMKANDNSPNQQHDIRWEVNVKPKQTFEITYARSFSKRI